MSDLTNTSFKSESTRTKSDKVSEMADLIVETSTKNQFQAEGFSLSADESRITVGLLNFPQDKGLVIFQKANLMSETLQKLVESLENSIISHDFDGRWRPCIS